MDTVCIHTRIYSAWIVIIAINWCINASAVRIARVFCASYLVIASDCNVFASSFRIARVSSASIAVVAALWGADTLAVYAGFCGANIFVITAKDVLALSVNTLVDCASIVIVTIDWCIHTTLS
jgi:hypothetical protein